MNEIFLDTETTGLSAKGGDRVLEIACIETENLIPTKKIFHKIINPEKEVTEEAFKIHGFSNEFLKNKKKFKDIADEFLEFINGKKIIIHNAPFDVEFLNSELSRVNRRGLNIKEIQETDGIVRAITWHSEDLDILQLDLKNVTPEEVPIVELHLYTIGSESKYIGEVWKAPEYNLLVVSMGIGIISSETVNEDTGIEPIDDLVDNLIPNPTDTTDEKNWNEMVDLIPEIYCYEEDWNS